MTIGPSGARSKTIATWLALLGGPFGLHRFYLHGLGDRWGWLLWPPTLIGAYGVRRMRLLGQDDQLAWLLIPLLGLVIAATMLTAIDPLLAESPMTASIWRAPAASERARSSASSNRPTPCRVTVGAR